MGLRFKFFISFMVGVFLATACFAGRLHPEKWCRENGGRTEVVMPDNTRCDCVTDTHAIEFDFADKWAEAIGQSLYYSLQTGKRAGIVLILESPKDHKYWLRLNTTINHFSLPIKVWSPATSTLEETRTQIKNTKA